MQTPFVIAVDQGTTSIRATVLAVDGEELKVVASRRGAVQRSLPRPGWVEIDAREVVAVTRRVAIEAMEAAGCPHGTVAAFGLANQGETVLVWDRRTLEPIAPAIVWQCRRTEAACERMRNGADAAWVLDKTGLPIDAYFSATKIAWILDEIPGARERARRGELAIGTLDAYTIACLSEGRFHVTDPSTACRTLLADLATGRFDERLCELFRVPMSLLPDVVASDVDLGSIALGGTNVPVRALLCDQPAALLGTGCLSPGDVKCTYGTGAFLQVNTGAAASPGAGDGLLRSIAWELAGTRTYLLEGSVLAAGDVLTWLEESLGILERADHVDAILRATPSAEGVLFVPSIAGLGAPRWVGGARATMLGLSRTIRREHVIRAALEGIAHQVSDVLDVARSSFDGSLTPMWADGGLANSDAFVALQADLAGTAVRRAAHSEATTHGIAAIAAARAGLGPSVAGLVRKAPLATFSPNLPEAERVIARDRHRRVLDLVTSAEVLALGASSD
jgi:glycerol kinase